MRFEELFDLNPWWEDPENIKIDRHIVLFEEKKYKYHPEKILNQIKIDQAGIYTLRGPRQIGKTSALKLLIRALLASDVDPKRIVYLPCDNMKDRFELTDIIMRYVRVFTQDRKLFLFIDEATLIPDWQLAIKYLVDTGFLDRAVVVITGSSAYDLKISSERLPGRRGVGRDIVYLPLSFKEFLTGFDIHVEGFSLRDLMSSSVGELKNLYVKWAHVKRYFDIYWLSGGIPFAINDLLENGTVTEKSIRTITDFIFGDIERYTKSRLRIMELMKKLPDIVGQRFSWNSLVNHIEDFAESPMTLQKYFELLSYLFVFATVYFLDPSTKKVRPKKQKKVYPIDTIVLKVLEKLSGKKVKEGHIAEMIVLRHLLDELRIHEGLNLYFGPYYWYSNKGNEIDFIQEENSMLVPIEVKYQNKISKSDYSSMLRVFGRGILITKDQVFKDRGVVGIPLWLFVISLG